MSLYLKHFLTKVAVTTENGFIFLMQIVLYNRIDGEHWSQINGVTIALKDTRFASNDYGGIRFGQVNNVVNNERIEIIPRTPKSGQYVKVWKPGNHRLQLCEVEVFRAKGMNTVNILSYLYW